jgi:uncharacterized membrane protein YraQ (UPF0718 family)
MVYMVDHFSQAWVCLVFAFVAAALIREFARTRLMRRYLGGGKLTAHRYSNRTVVQPRPSRGGPTDQCSWSDGLC